jgi:hypothetical protein
MALYIPHSIFHLALLLYVRPEAFGPYYVHAHVYNCWSGLNFGIYCWMLLSNMRNILGRLCSLIYQKSLIPILIAFIVDTVPDLICTFGLLKVCS